VVVLDAHSRANHHGFHLCLRLFERGRERPSHEQMDDRIHSVQIQRRIVPSTTVFA
jgi:hypothetical protein